MRYRFDEFTLDPDSFAITRAGELIYTEPQVIELLALLVANSHRMVSKEEINQVVWRGRVVSESALSSRIKMARSILGDDGKTQRYIRTIHKKGFRFIGNLVLEAEPETQANVAASAIADGHHLRYPCVLVLPFANLSDEIQDGDKQIWLPWFHIAPQK